MDRAQDTANAVCELQQPVAAIPPRIGQPWPGLPGSLYSGIGAAEEEDGLILPEGHVVVLDGSMTREFDHQGCIDWAAQRGDRIPTQREGALITANLRGLLSTSVSWGFWTSTKFGTASAWYCYLDYGTVSFNLRRASAGGVAVRRFPLQSFTSSASAE